MLNISENGEILQDINVIDVLYANDLERLLFQHWKTEGDVTHLNDIEPLSSSLADEYPLFEAGDLVVSLKNINLVFVFDPETNKVKWHARDPFIQQHDPDFIGDGWIGIFDNNWKSGRTSGGSEILAMQPHTDSTKILFKPDHLDRFYTYIRGKWQNLPNGNLLLTESETSRVVEVTPGGHLVWEWVYDSDDPKIPPLTDAVRHDLTREQIASWPCSSTGVTYTSSNER